MAALHFGAFVELSTQRTGSDMGPNPISWESMAAYLRLNPFPNPALFTTLIRALDAAYIEHALTKPEKEKGDAPPTM